MSEVPEITTINVGEETYEVADLSQEVQELVTVYNRWAAKEAEKTECFNEMRDELLRFQTARQALINQIMAAVNRHLEEEAAAAASEANTTEPPPAEEAAAE